MGQLRPHTSLGMPCAAYLVALGHHMGHVAAVRGMKQMARIDAQGRIAPVADVLTRPDQAIFVPEGIDVGPHLTPDEVAAITVTRPRASPDPAPVGVLPCPAVKVNEFADEEEMVGFIASHIRATS